MKHKCVGGQTGTPEDGIKQLFYNQQKNSDERTLHCYTDPSCNDYKD